MDGLLFSQAQIDAMSGGRRPPAPVGYKLPTQFPSFKGVKRLSLDLESKDKSLSEKRGPGWRRGAYIVGFALAIQEHDGSIGFSEYYPLRHKGVQNLDADRIMGWLGTEMAFYTGEIVGANLLYDGDGFQYQSVEAPLAKWRDVQWAEALLDENALSYQLGTLARNWLGGGKWNDELKNLYGPNYIERFDEVHPGHARTYGLGDVHLPLGILIEQEKELRKQHLWDLFDLESRLLPFLLYMRRKGVRVDMLKAAGLHTELEQRRDAALREASKKCGIDLTPDNFGKPSVLERVFNAIKEPFPYLLPGDIIVKPGDPKHDEILAGKLNGKPSFRDKWLTNHDHDVAHLLQIANKCEKAKTTFVDGYITDNAIGDRIHCEFHPLRKKEDEFTKSKGTITGRFSSANPNLQNIPTRDDEIGPACRGVFIPEEGADWWSQDYCIAPHTRVLTANLEWKRADQVSLGEELVGCDELAQGAHGWGTGATQRRMRRTRIVAIKDLLQPRVRITTDKGTLVCSTKHRWLARHEENRGRAGGYEWTPSENLISGQRLAWFCDTWEVDRTYEAGWLSGIYDGEGCLDAERRQLDIAQNAGKGVLESAFSLLKHHGFAPPVPYGPVGKAQHIRLTGRSRILRALGRYRPVRLLRSASKLWEGQTAHGRDASPATVLSVEHLSTGPVIAIQTETGTFVAEGFHSHNSQIEYRFLCHYACVMGCTGADVPKQMYHDNPNTDFHDMCAMMMYKDKWNAVLAKYASGRISEKEKKSLLKALRTPAKNLNFGMVYGMGEALLASQLEMCNTDGSANDAAKQIMKEYHEAAPYIRDLNKKCVKYAEEHGYIPTILGRRGRFDLWEPRFTEKGQKHEMLPYDKAVEKWGKEKLHVAMTHKALNKKLQGSAADLMKKAMVHLWEGGVFAEDNDITCVLTVHDELNGSVWPTERGKKALEEVKYVMEHCMELEIPIMTSGSTGRTWAEAK